MKEVQSSVGTPRRENPISKLVRAGSEPLHKTTLQILPPPESHPWDSFHIYWMVLRGAEGMFYIFPLFLQSPEMAQE